MKYLAEKLDSRNLGQALIWDDGNGMSIIQEIVHEREAGFVTVYTASGVFEFPYGKHVETALSPELRMLRILMNAVEGLETAVA